MIFFLLILLLKGIFAKIHNDTHSTALWISVTTAFVQCKQSVFQKVIIYAANAAERQSIFLFFHLLKISCFQLHRMPFWFSLVTDCDTFLCLFLLLFLSTSSKLLPPAVFMSENKVLKNMTWLSLKTFRNPPCHVFLSLKTPTQLLPPQINLVVRSEVTFSVLLVGLSFWSNVQK